MPKSSNIIVWAVKELLKYQETITCFTLSSFLSVSLRESSFFQVEAGAEGEEGVSYLLS